MERQARRATRTRTDRRTTTRDAEVVSGEVGRALSSLALGGVMLLAGGTKLAGTNEHVESFERWGYPQWFRVLTGAVEVTGGFGLLLGRSRPRLATLGGTLVAGTMLGALYTHLLRVRDPPAVAARPGVLFGIALVSIRDARRRTAAATEESR
jgi:uncharacterized membrane protein YphA (DoxX/SURF4 family)